MATPTNLPAAVNVGDVATSTWANDIRGSFRILQVVSATSSTAWSNTTNTFTDVTGVTVDITPQATSSKIFVVVSITGAYKATNNTSLDLEIRRGATTILTAGSNFNTATTATNAGTVVLTYLDSPATTALRTYKVRGRSSANLATVGASLGGDSTITVFEVSA
jgi:hypothetical protein